MAFDREAHLAKKKAERERQKANKKKIKDTTVGGAIAPPRKVRVTSTKPRVHDDNTDARGASRLSPEDRAALRMPNAGGGLASTAQFPHLQTAVSTGTATPPEDRSEVVETPFKPDYEQKGAASGVKPIALDADRWEFTCPTCHEIKHESQRNKRSKLGKCIDCMPKK